MEASGGERLEFGGITIVVHADADATGGAFSVMEVPPLADTPLHIHAHEDEFFYAVEGEHVITVGEREYRLAPGRGCSLRAASRTRSAGSSRASGGSCSSSRPAGSRVFRRLAAAQAAENLDAAAYAAASEEFGTPGSKRRPG